MAKITRRSFIESAIAIGATAAWSSANPAATKTHWKEQREFFPEGVASGDPDPSSVLLWTRCSPGVQHVTTEVAEDPAFQEVVAIAHASVSADSDWTCRVLVGGLRPSTVYWYRFTDPEGNGSRIGRTITAPDEHDTRPSVSLSSPARMQTRAHKMRTGE